MAENYWMDGAATLSSINGETTDNLIASALTNLPVSAVGGILPVVKTKGPTSQWVEPWWFNEGFKMLTTPVDMFNQELNNRRRLEVTADAVEAMVRTYSEEAFVNTVKGWFIQYKNQMQRIMLVDALDNLGIVPYAEAPALHDNATEDKIKDIRNKVLAAIQDISNRFQLGGCKEFSIVAPYEMSYALMELQDLMGGVCNGLIHVMYDDTLDSVYVFPTGDDTLSRSGLAIFEYSDTYQRAVDSRSGNPVFFFYSRSSIIVNPVHEYEPIINRILLV